MLYASRKLAENLSVYLWQGRDNNCNSVLFTDVLNDGGAHVLVDPGHIANRMGEDCFGELARAMEADGYAVEDIGLVINTHSHPDHCEANRLVVERSGADIALSEEEEQFRKSEGRKLLGMAGGQDAEFTPLFFLKEGSLDLGDPVKIALEVFLAPGHSRGSICLYWPEKKLLISGDVLFAGSIGRTDLPGGSHNELKRSIDRLSDLDVEILVPGHSTQYGAIVEGAEQNRRNFQIAKMFF